MSSLANLATRFGVTWTSLAWGVLVFVLSAGASLALVTAIVVRLPADYFAAGAPVVASRGLPARIGKNLLGAVLVVIGALLAIPGVPGQGVLTVFIGVMLLDFPGKRRLELRFVSRPKVRRSIDDLRARFGRPPLVLAERDQAPRGR